MRYEFAHPVSYDGPITTEDTPILTRTRVPPTEPSEEADRASIATRTRAP